MKTIKLNLLSLGLLLALLLPRLAQADLVGNYTADANTLFLLHFDEAAGGTFATNNGSKGGNFYSITEAVASATPATVTTMLGAAGYVNGPTNFNNCMTNPTTGYEFGFDANNSGAYQGEGTAPCPDAILMTNLNIGFGGQTSFTLEALIRPNQVSVGTQEIICTDSSAGSRAFQFRINAGTVQFTFVTGGATMSGTIPTTGNDAFVAGNWYHIAFTYDGANGTIYWTLLNPTNGAAHILSTAALAAIGTTQGAVTGPLIIGNENRGNAGEQFQGSIDEVRISSVARGSGQMQFYSPLVTITANPVSQNVDYNQPVTFSVSASSQFPITAYQWRLNSNSIAGATNSSYSITNVAANNGGYYDCLVSNSIGNSATSAEAILVVGAANFIANRYSFNSSSIDPGSGLPTTPDSIGGQTGTNFGNATVSGGQLVLDGTSGTFMQLPGNLFNAGNATALTIEFWATYGTNPNNVYPFSFGKTNFVINQGIIGFNYVIYSSHNPTGQSALATPGDPGVSVQTVSAPGNLDGRTVHVAVVVDPPNKQFSIYTNGVLEAINTNFTVNLSSLNNQLSYIGKSLYAADPYLNASIDELRIFKGALSGITIKQSQDQGPNTLLADGPAKYTLQPASISVPAGQIASFTVATVGYLPITYQWFKNGALIPGATNASYSFATVIGDNGSTFLAHATNVIGVTTYVTNSTTATLTVFIPPTLAWLDAANGGADSSWNTTSLDWTNQVNSIVAFAQTNGALFDSRGSGSPTVDIAQSIIPYNITVNAASDYLLTSSANTGSFDGQAAIIKQNSGKLTIDLTNNLTGTVTVSGGILQVGNSDGFGTLGSGPVTNNATLSFNRADAVLNVGNAMHGTGTVSFDGAGSVVVSGANDYTGSTLINAGILNLQSSTGLGAASTGTTVISGGQLYITANVNVAEPLSLNGVGDGGGALRKGGAGLTVESATVALAADATIGVDNGATLTLSNVVSGAFALTANGGGALTLNANNTYSGGLILNGAIVGLNAGGALGTVPATVSGAGRFVLGDGVTISNPIRATTVNAGVSLGLVMVGDNTNGTITTYSGPLTLDASPTLGGVFVGPNSSGYLNITGPVTNTVTGVVTSRSGFVRFAGGGDYTLFILNQGTASLGANNGLCPNTALQMSASGGSAFDLNGFSQALTGLNDGSANSKLLTNSTATLSTLTLNLAANSTFSGVIAGKVALVENGAANLLLSGTNAYTGNTTVNGGTLELAVASLAVNSTVTVASGAVLQLDFVETNTVAGLVLNGVTQAAGVYSAVTSSPYLAGSGSLLVGVSVATNPTNIIAKVNSGKLELSWPADHLGWRLQTQTNALSSGLGTNWVTVPNSTTVNSVTNTINALNGSVFYRMVYP